MPESPSATPLWGTHPSVVSGRDRVRFGIAYGPQLDPRVAWPTLFDFVRTAEALGFDSYETEAHMGSARSTAETRAEGPARGTPG